MLACLLGMVFFFFVLENAEGTACGVGLFWFGICWIFVWKCMGKVGGLEIGAGGTVGRMIIAVCVVRAHCSFWRRNSGWNVTFTHR